MNEKLKTAMEDKGKRTAIELVASAGAIDLISLLANIFIRKNNLGLINNRLAFTLGELLGFLVVVFMIWHMYRTLEGAMLLDKKHAKHKAKLGAFVRMLVIVAALAAAALLPDYISLVGVLCGILALKIAALIWPWIDKFVMKIIKKEE